MYIMSQRSKAHAKNDFTNTRSPNHSLKVEENDYLVLSKNKQNTHLLTLTTTIFKQEQYVWFIVLYY